MKTIDILNPKDFLNAELAIRCKSNPQYSLRSFARALQLSPSALSLILSGKRGISFKTAQNIAQKLGLNPQLSQALVNGSLKKHIFDMQLNNFENGYQKLSMDMFEVISDWYHFAILSLIETKDFQPSAKFIATRLGISLIEAKNAVERLVRLGILDTSTKKWKRTTKPIKFENTVSTAATRKFHRQLLDKAMYSLENDPMEIRDFSSMTIAINPKLIPTALEQIRKFRRELTTLLEGQGNQQEVYHLAVQIYPVSKRQNKE